MAKEQFKNPNILKSTPFNGARRGERFENILNKDGQYINKSLSGLNAAIDTNYGVIFIANFGITISSVQVIWSASSTSGTLNIERLSGTEALDAGDELLKTNIDMSGTANTVNKRESTRELQNQILKPGDRLALKDGGTLTNLEDLCVTIYFKRVGKGDYR